MIKFVERLKDLRIRSGVSQRGIAEQAGFTEEDDLGRIQSQVSRYETGITDADSFPVWLLVLWLEACSTSIATFMTQLMTAEQYEKHKTALTEDRELRRAFNNALLIPKDRQKVFNMFVAFGLIDDETPYRPKK